jgi:hypothetical protein
MAVELEERFYETNRAQLLRWLPWLHLFRAFRIALDVRKIVLGALAAFVLIQGDRLIVTLPFAPLGGVGGERRPPVSVQDDFSGLFESARRETAEPVTVSPHWFETSPVLWPLRTIIEPGRALFERGNSWADAAYHWTRLLFHLALWSLAGAAISRMASVHFAHRESQTVRSALQYVAARFRSIIGAPLLPVVFIGFFWLICVLLGLVGRVPGIGPAIVGILWFLPLLIGMALAVMLLVISVSWPLMIATISTEGPDAFDGLSRGYDYALNRTWYALWLVLLMVIYGTVVIMFSSYIVLEGVRLASWAVASGMGEDNLRQQLIVRSPAMLTDPAAIDGSTPDTIAGSEISFWLHVLTWLLKGFTVSFFWTAATIIYFLLRLSLDAKPLDHVFVPAVQASGQTLPLVGIPAAEKRQSERQSPDGNAGAESASVP